MADPTQSQEREFQATATVFQLITAYKRFSLLFFTTSIGLALALGWHLHESNQQQQQLNNLKQSANDAQWELENSPPPEGTMRAIKLLEGALE